jgi:HD superfamily phosphohydrolase YqeK
MSDQNYTHALSALHEILKDVRDEKIKTAARRAIEQMLPRLTAAHSIIRSEVAAPYVFGEHAPHSEDCEGCRNRAIIAAVDLDTLSSKEMIHLYEAVFEALSRPGCDEFVILGGGR